MTDNPVIKTWQMPSFSNPKKHYTVSLHGSGGYSCDCPAWVYNHSGDRLCKHILTLEAVGFDEKVVTRYAKENGLIKQRTKK